MYFYSTWFFYAFEQLVSSWGRPNCHLINQILFFSIDLSIKPNSGCCNADLFSNFFFVADFTNVGGTPLTLSNTIITIQRKKNGFQIMNSKGQLGNLRWIHKYTRNFQNVTHQEKKSFIVSLKKKMQYEQNFVLRHFFLQWYWH